MVDTVTFIQGVGVMILGMIILGWIFFLFHLLFKKVFKGLFRSLKKKDPKKYEWCMDAIRNGNTRGDVQKTLLLDGWKKKDMAEMMFIFDKCYKTLNKKTKGGKKHE